MTLTNYYVYQNRILTKTTGLNIHKVRNKLAAIKMLLGIREEALDEEKEEIEQTITEIRADIRRILKE